MLLRKWTRRNLQIAWAIGLLAEAVLIGATVIANRRDEADWDRRWGRFMAPGLPATPSQRDSALRLLRDQTGISLDIRHDTIVAVHVPPATEHAVAVAVRQFWSGLAAAAVLALGVYLAIPMALLILTLLWYRAHRPSGATFVSPAA